MTQNILCFALSAILLALRVPAEAQQPQKIPRIGYIAARAADMEQTLLPVFLQGLRELGYTEGKNIVIEQRYAPGGFAGAAGLQERIRELVAELLRLKVDVIVASGTAVEAKAVTTTIPIVFIASAAPVELGLVESLARPGGNVTGLSDFHGHLVAKRLELLKEVVPAAARIAFLWMAGSLTAPRQWQQIQAAAPDLGVTPLTFEVAGSDDIDRALTAMAQAGVEALVVHPTVTYTTSQHWSLVDGFYFAITTLTTSSIADPHLTITGAPIKIFTAFYILVGIGILVELARQLGFAYVEVRRQEKAAKQAKADAKHAASAPSD